MQVDLTTVSVLKFQTLFRTFLAAKMQHFLELLKWRANSVDPHQTALKWRANSVDPHQTAPEGAVWSGSALFAYTILSTTLVYEILGHLPYFKAGLGDSVGCASDWRPGGRGFDPRWGRQRSFVEIDHEIFSTVVLSLQLIQEGQLSVSGERMCTILINCLED